jgi:hypothetical protein
MAVPTIAGKEIAPFGISVVTYLIIAGVFILKQFFDRQVHLETKKDGQPLLKVSLLSNKTLRASLAVLTAQFTITAAVFFVIPVYLQISQGLDALETGIKILPLSIALILSSVVGSRLTNFEPRRIVKAGQMSLLAGVLVLLAAIDPTLTGYALGLSLALVGTGLGLLASQLSNIAVGAVGDDNSSEVGGMTGTFQNLGSSLGTALIGSVMVVSLTSGFVSSVNASSLPNEIKEYITTNSQVGVAIVPPAEVATFAESQGVSVEDSAQIASTYAESQLESLKRAISFLAIITALSLMLSKNLPNK